MQVLFIGNSYTYNSNMPKLFEALAIENGRDVTAYAVTQGGRKLFQYAECDDATTRELAAQLAARRYDVCFIQEQSLLPATEPERFLWGLEQLLGRLKGRVDTVYLYETWGRKAGNADLEALGWTHDEMAQRLVDAYRGAAAQFGVGVSPAGENFHEVYLRYPEIAIYEPDLSHPDYKGCCLIALTHYYTVFGEFPQKAASLRLTEEELAAFCVAVCRKK